MRDPFLSMIGFGKGLITEGFIVEIFIRNAMMKDAIPMSKREIEGYSSCFFGIDNGVGGKGFERSIMITGKVTRVYQKGETT